MNIAHPPFSA